MNRLTIAAITLCLSAACGSTGTKIDPERQLALHRELALRYYDMGDLMRAEDQATRGLAIEEGDAQLKLLLGWVRQRRGKTEDILVAERVFRDLLPDGDYRAVLGLAESLERKGVLYREASEGVASGERITSSKDPTARAVELADLARDAWRESIERYHETLKKKPNDGQALNGLQRVYALLGRFDESLAWSRSLIEQSRAELAVWNGQLQRPDLTVEEEKRLRDLRESTERLLVESELQASTLLVAMDRRPEALDHARAALELAPDDADVHARCAQLEMALGRYEEADRNLDEFLRLSPHEFEHPDVQRAYAMKEECRAKLGVESPVSR